MKKSFDLSQKIKLIVMVWVVLFGGLTIFGIGGHLLFSQVLGNPKGGTQKPKTDIVCNIVYK
ncbi:MAG: hypothetical protein FWD76_00420, partial [Firmicutes bacterium]|nr:hypothetical protein [Bacillota bacterium]